MLRTIDNGRTGVIAQQMRLDTVANNLANVNTTAFKKQEVTFADLLYQEINAAGRPVERTGVSVSPSHGAGVKAAALPRIFSDGAQIVTGRMLDVAIAGEGFLRVELPAGGYAYTRNGRLQVSSHGRLTDENGHPLAPSMVIPENCREVTIGFDGKILVHDESGATEEVGRLFLYKFFNPGGLRAYGKNLYVPTEASGEPQAGEPGSDGFGVLRPGCLEASNVELAQEMANLLVAQRIYQLSLRIIQSAEEMWNQVNNLRK